MSIIDKIRKYQIQYNNSIAEINGIMENNKEGFSDEKPRTKGQFYKSSIKIEYNGTREEAISSLVQDKTSDANLISDGYHTFGELYEFRKMYNAVLFNEWASYEGWGGKITPKHNVHKSWKHSDGELAFGGGWFIVSAMLPTGLISNHYKAEDWDLFKVPEVEKALFEYDGHTGADVLERLKGLC